MSPDEYIAYNIDYINREDPDWDAFYDQIQIMSRKDVTERLWACEVFPEVEGLSYIPEFFACEASGRNHLAISSRVKFIGSHAFEAFKSLQTIQIPYSVRTIRISAFQNCRALSSIAPLGVVHIDAWAFAGCSDLREVRLGSGLGRIGAHAFNSCRSLSRIIYSGRIKDWQLVKLAEKWRPFEQELTIRCVDGEVYYRAH